MGFGIKKALYSTSVPGATLPPAKDYFKLLNGAIPVTAAKDLDQLARESDVLILCCSLTPTTKGLVGAEFLKKMKKSAYLINTSRGGVVDSVALDEALKAGELAGAGLDVLDGEPNIPASHPLVLNEKCIVLPHLGSATVETRTLMCHQAVQNMWAGLGLKGKDAQAIEWINEVKA